MGDEITEEIEELETSEETEIEGDDTETLETEDQAETDDGVKDESEETDPPKTVPYERFKDVNEKAKKADEYQQKLDQLKQNDPEGYYKYFPDERPEGESAAPAPVTSVEGSLIVEGGAYDGMTIDDVAKQDPIAAINMILDHRDNQTRETASRQAETRKMQEEVDRELEEFSGKLSQDFFKKDKDLTEEETGKINDVISETLAWANKTGRGGKYIMDAYYLMNRENDLAKARGETVKSLAASLRSGETASISSSKTTPTDTGWERFAGYTATEAMEELEKLPDEDNARFLKEAPKSVRSKFPKLNWKD